ncbi:MAG: PEP-CTERM sorting domain-containing protein [Pseudomonadota bacterium]|jgi:hypothetical protein
MKKSSRNWLSALVLALSAPVCANATTISTDASITDSIPGLTGFATFGDQMAGMTVQAIFANQLNETRSWGATGAGAGGAFGTGWSLTESGDTFSNSWVFTNNTGAALLGLVLDARPGLTVFDRTFGGAFGTPGSARGLDFAETPTTAGTAIYSLQVAIGADPAVGDLWHMLSVSFDQGLRGDWTFVQDTDSDLRSTHPAPEPATLALTGLGLAGLAAVRRRRLPR